MRERRPPRQAVTDLREWHMIWFVKAHREAIVIWTSDFIYIGHQRLVVLAFDNLDEIEEVARVREPSLYCGPGIVRCHAHHPTLTMPGRGGSPAARKSLSPRRTTRVLAYRSLRACSS